MIRFILPLLFAASLIQAAEKPNVLFISIDDLNDWIGPLGGHPQVQTPNMDRLAARGTNFTNAHCQAPICNPSRISMLLGKLPSTTGHYFLQPGFREVEVTKDDTTLFQYFRQHGYYASTMGKIFHGHADKASFDHIEPARGYRKSKDKIRYTLPGTHPLWDWGQVDVPDEEQRDYITADWAAGEIPKLAAAEKPFILAVGFSLPHVPIYASKKWFDLYPLESLEMPPTPEGDLDDISQIAIDLSLNMTAPRHSWMVETGEDKHAVQAYLATISFVDSLVGMLLDSLEKSGVAGNTYVVLWSDHGFHMGEKNKWAKRSLWERTTRVPLILAGPGISEGMVCEEPVGLIDVYPTLNDLCGLPEKDDLEGHSLRPLLEDPEAEWPHPAICTFGPENHSIHTRNYHYIHYLDGSEELYDHRSDPDELTNLASEPKMEDILKQHRQLMPVNDAAMVPGSRGSDSPLYGESEGLQKAMKRKK